MHRTARAAVVFRLRFAELDSLRLQLTGKFCPLQGILVKERLQICILHALGSLPEAFLPIFQCFDQSIDRRNDFFLLCHTISSDEPLLLRPCHALAGALQPRFFAIA